MEYLLVITVLIGSVIGLYFFIKKQIEINSKESKKEFESKLDTFVEAFKLESAKNLANQIKDSKEDQRNICLLYTSPSPRDATLSRMPSSA